MKSFEIVSTEENLISALQDDLLMRNQEIVYFYNLLMSLESATTLALDGRWGSGKTFFVRQTMLAINAKNKTSNMDDEKRAKITYKLPFNKDDKESVNCDLAVYYDAWEHDNDTDPILSLVYEITKQLSIDYDFKNTDIFETAASILEAISGRNFTSLLECLRGENPLEKFEIQRNLSEKIREFFSDILTGRGEHLVVFIDELDRCNPTYAVKLLEQVKHYLFYDKVTFVFSVNLQELQHTIRHYYGEDFDSCRYLDRFFDLRISLPPANLSAFYNKLGLESSIALETVTKRVIEMYHFELREITRFYRQVKSAAYIPTHDNQKYAFCFPDEKAKSFMLVYILPLVIGTKMADISLYDDFINGKNAQPLIDLFANDQGAEWKLAGFINKNNESFKKDEKNYVEINEVIRRIYYAIFVNKYDGHKYSELIGDYSFDAQSKKFVLETSSMLSEFADFNV